MAPRTKNAPWSAVQKMAGLSAAENGLILLAVFRPPSASLAIGKPRSPPGPPSDSYLVRMSVSMALAPVAGLKKILPPAKFWASPSLPAGYWSPCLAPSAPDGPPAARQAMLISAVGSTGTCRLASLPARSGGTVVKALVSLFHDNLPPLNDWVASSPSKGSSPVGTPSAPPELPSLSHAALIAPRTTKAPWSAVQ